MSPLKWLPASARESIKLHLKLIAIGYPVAAVLVLLVALIVGFPAWLALPLAVVGGAALVIAPYVAFVAFLDEYHLTPRQERRVREERERAAYESYAERRLRGRD